MEDQHLLNESDFYKNLPRLETERLIIRRYTVDDADDYFQFASDPEVVRHLRWGPHPDLEYTREYIKGVVETYSLGKDSSWGIELKSDERLIGTIHLMQLDLYNKKAHIGFVIGRDHWNNGHATEALKCVLDYCFSELSLNRIEALCIPENHAARRVLEKAGMQLEGLLRKYAFQKDAFRDFMLFSILRTDLSPALP